MKTEDVKNVIYCLDIIIMAFERGDYNTGETVCRELRTVLIGDLRDYLISTGLEQAKAGNFSDNPPDLDSDQKLVDEIDSTGDIVSKERENNDT